MSIVREPQVGCKQQTVSDEYRRWVFSRMPAVGSLLDKLDAGNTPNFLDIMAGISEMVAFQAEGDLLFDGPHSKNILMSGKYCRFCC